MPYVIPANEAFRFHHSNGRIRIGIRLRCAVPPPFTGVHRHARTGPRPARPHPRQEYDTASMTEPRYSTIRRVAVHVPPARQTGSEIEDEVRARHPELRLLPGLLKQMYGFGERRVAPAGALPSDLAAAAARRLLGECGLGPDAGCPVGDDGTTPGEVKTGENLVGSGCSVEGGGDAYVRRHGDPVRDDPKKQPGALRSAITARRRFPRPAHRVPYPPAVPQHGTKLR